MNQGTKRLLLKGKKTTSQNLIQGYLQVNVIHQLHKQESFDSEIVNTERVSNSNRQKRLRLVLRPGEYLGCE